MSMRRRTFIAGLGSAAALPLLARAQERAVPVIGYLYGGTSGESNYIVEAFRKGLTRIMHHAEGFCTSLRRACADDPSVWIGVRQLAMQHAWD